jgi:phytoene dehydrogenase-like protein
MITERRDIIVVGRGLAGLAAAIYAARGGARVVLLERSARLGGRAITNVRDGYYLNLGPHALYRGGCAAAALTELGVKFDGGSPSLSGAFAYHGGRLHTFPSEGVSLLVTGLMRLEAKQELAAFRKSLPSQDANIVDSLTVDEWLLRSLTDPMARQVMQALIRTATFIHASDRYSAGAALRQLQLAVGGVLYLDHGWGSIADGLVDGAGQAGVELVPSCVVKSVESAAAAGARVWLDDGSKMDAAAVIIATRPGDAVKMLDDANSPLAPWFEHMRPARVACLDLGLRKLPNPANSFALGIDQPLYFSVHSEAGHLAPSRCWPIHVAKYLGDGVSLPASDRAEMESLLDLVQPEFRNFVEVEQFLPAMTVVDAFPTARNGGLNGQPGPAVAGYPRVFVAGQWVGPRGQLADASLASAKRAAGLALQVASVSEAVSQMAS